MNRYPYNPTQGGYAADGGAGQTSLVSAVMRNVYLKMFLGLLVTAAVAWIVAATASADSGFLPYMVTHRWVYWGIALGELGLVLWLSARLGKMHPAMAAGLFFVFAAVNGLTLSLIFVVYTMVSIFKTFLITAGVFGAMSIYGYFTSKDLSRIGSILYMALFGLIILLVVNIFWANSTLEWIVSIIGVLIFIGLTAWDTQRIKRVAEADPGFGVGRLSTMGALILYLDFINLFIYLLRFFGVQRD